jgi:hypothetical protein
MARLWEIREDYESDYRHSSFEDELHKAYKKGCKHGYEKAMEEMEYRKGGMNYRKNEDDEDYAEYRRGGRMGR